MRPVTPEGRVTPEELLRANVVPLRGACSFGKWMAKHLESVPGERTRPPCAGPADVCIPVLR